MKKTLALVLALMLVLSTAALSAFAADTADVYVTISDGEGKLVLTQEKITVSDIDDDGALTINDALYAAHEAKFEGGAAEGYASGESAYGLSLNKLWGIENGGSYGYYVNNASAWSLVDPIADGDYIKAYVYQDLTAWSDTYTYFDVNTIESEQFGQTTLTLSAAGFDESYNPITLPVANAVITINGVESEFVTDAEGKVTIGIDSVGTYVISAISESMTIVPPVCTLTVAAPAEAPVETPEVSEPVEDEASEEVPVVEEKEEVVTAPETGFESNIMFFAALIAVSAAGIVILTVKGRKINEK